MARLQPGAPCKLRRGLVAVVVLATLPWIVAGCRGRQTIEGTVTLDGRPLERGYINFRPMTGAKGPTLGGAIEQGNYAIQSTVPLEGHFRVEITALGKTGNKFSDETGKEFDVEGQVLPERYNAKSTLQVEIQRGKCHVFPFLLQSK
jgi:hypothetical protein